MGFKIVRNDITKVKADAIVNTANPSPTYGGGVDYAVYKAAGMKELLAAREKIGSIKPGDAFATPAFKLNAKYIIHTVGPCWLDGIHGELETLYSCYRKSLMLAAGLGCRSIAFPLISTGTYGFPKDKALSIANEAFKEFLEENEMNIILVVFDRDSFQLSGDIAAEIAQFIDANYVEKQTKTEYACDFEDYSPKRELILERIEYENAELKKISLDDSYNEIRRRSGPATESRRRTDGECSLSTKRCRNISQKSIAPEPYVPDIGTYIKGHSKEMNFREKICEYMNKRNLSAPQVYKNYISKSLFGKIMNDHNYHPGKGTAFMMCLSLHLDVDAATDLLRRAGHAFNPSSKADLVIEWCLIKHIYNMVYVDEYVWAVAETTTDKIR